LIHHRDRQGGAIGHAVTVTTEAGKAANLSRLATHQGCVE
jgi:hypothetical protein